MKPNGIFLNGDPYIPEKPIIKERLYKFQKERSKIVKGQSWDQYWNYIDERYKIKKQNNSEEYVRR